MPVPEVSIQNGTVVNGVALTLGNPFVWLNPTGVNVQLSNCGGFATQATYNVPANGTKAAQLLAAPTNYSFTEFPNEWNAPGLPHISSPPLHAADEKKEVA